MSWYTGSSVQINIYRLIFLTLLQSIVTLKYASMEENKSRVSQLGISY